MVIPVGGQFQVQQLMLVEKSADGKVKNRQVLPVHTNKILNRLINLVPQEIVAIPFPL